MVVCVGGLANSHFLSYDTDGNITLTKDKFDIRCKIFSQSSMFLIQLKKLH